MKDELKHRHVPAEDLRNATVNEVVKDNPGIMTNLDNFIKKVGKKFVENKLLTFPKLCIETRRVNYLKRKQLREIDNEGGWSESKEFKFDFDIPRELYLFMINMIYINFWAEENEKIWRSFMKAVLRGDDPDGILRGVKIYYLGAQGDGTQSS